MRVIVFASRKGGVGRSTLTSHLAVEAERVGAGPVATIDTDDMQGLAQWWDARSANTPALVRLTGTLRQTAASLETRGFKLLFVDTPPALNASIAALVADAALVLVPVQPSPDDIRAVSSTIELVDRAKRPMVFVINRTKPRARLTGEAAIALSQYGTVAPVMVGDRTDYAGAKTDGRTAPELNPSGPAAKEMAALWSYIAGRLEAVA